MSQWDSALLSNLVQGRRVILFDYPGLGSSGPPSEKITFTATAEWTAEFLAAIGVRRTDVLGWSMGGFVTQELLTRHKRVVRRVLLAGINPGGPGTVLGPKWAQRIDSDPDAGLAGYLATNYPRTKCGRTAGRAAVDRINAAIGSGRYPKARIPNRTYRATVRAEQGWPRSRANTRRLACVRKSS
jgi:pimeloyl-ACP methyl ester carboxylesterase